MQHSASVWIHIRKAKHTPNSTALVVFKALCTLDLKLGGAAKCSNSAPKKFFWQKSLTCWECAQPSLVYCIVNETCGEKWLLHYSVAFCSQYIPGEKKTKNTLKYDIFSVLSVLVWKTRPNQDSHLVKPTVLKVTHYVLERTFLWHTSATCPECVTIPLVR